MEVLNEGAVADEQAIRQLTASFSDAVNRRAFDDFGQLWLPDGVWAIPGLEDAVGPNAIVAQLEQLISSFDFLLQLLHGGQVWVEGDAARARWYLVELGRTSDGQGVHFAGVYQDRLVRTNAGWKFGARKFDFLYRGFADLPGKAYPFPPLAGAGPGDHQA
jgi:ketosteroid isomerase-like protein